MLKFLRGSYSGIAGCVVTDAHIEAGRPRCDSDDDDDLTESGAAAAAAAAGGKPIASLTTFRRELAAVLKRHGVTLTRKFKDHNYCG